MRPKLYSTAVRYGGRAPDLSTMRDYSIPASIGNPKVIYTNGMTARGSVAGLAKSTLDLYEALRHQRTPTDEVQRGGLSNTQHPTHIFAPKHERISTAHYSCSPDIALPPRLALARLETLHAAPTHPSPRPGYTGPRPTSPQLAFVCCPKPSLWCMHSTDQ